MKTFNFFEKLWEHSRTLRRVGLVLVMCLMAIPQLWGYSMEIYFCPEDLWGGYWDEDTKYCQLNLNKRCNGNDAWETYSMTKTAWTKDGKAIWKGNPTNLCNDGAQQIQFLRKRKSDNYQEWSDQKYDGWMMYNSTNTFYYGSWQALSKDQYVNGGYVYFDNSQTGWTTTYKYLVIGRDAYSRVYALTRISNTDLWYVYLDGETNHTWEDATYCAFIGSDAEWGDGDFGPSTITDASKYTATYPVNYSNSILTGRYYLYRPASSSDGAELSRDNYASCTGLNWDITFKAKIKAFGEDSYAEGTSKGKVGVNRYNYGDATSCNSSGSNGGVLAVGGTSGTYAMGYVSTRCTLTVSNVVAGYTFRGWYAGGTKLSDDIPYRTYSPRETTVYAYFEENSYTITYNNMTGATNHPSNPSSYGVTSSTITLQAPTKDGYVFAGWCSDEDCKTRVTSIPSGSTGNKVFYAKWLSAHEPGKYTATGSGGYGKTLKDVSGIGYERYVFGVSSSKVYVGADTKTTSTGGACVLSYATATGNFDSGGEWLSGTAVSNTSSATTLDITGTEFASCGSVQGLKHSAEGQGLLLNVKGYTEFAIVAKDNDATKGNKKYLQVLVNGSDVTDNLSTDKTRRSYSLTAGTRYTIQIKSLSSSENQFWGFSLKPGTPTITVHPSTSSASYDVGDAATALSVTATKLVSSGTTLSYQWYSNTTASNSGGTIIGGATSASYTPPTTSAGTKYYYCVVSETGCNSTTSSVSGAIIVTAACTTPTIEWTASPADGNVGGNRTISVTSNYPTGVTITSDSENATLTNRTVDGSTVSYTLNYAVAGNANITASVDGDGSTVCDETVNLDAVTITISKNTPTDFTVSGGGTLCSGGDADITLSGSQSGISYQLYNGASTVGDAVSGTGSALTWADVATAGTYTVKAVANDAYNAATMSGSATITFYDDISIGTQPTASVNATVSSAASLSGLALSSGSFNNAAYQWQTCDKDDASGTNTDITSGSAYANYNTATLSFTPSSTGTYYFRCVVSDDCGNSEASNVVTVTAVNSYTVTYNKNGATSGTAPSDGSSPYSSGSTVTVKDTTGCKFVYSGYVFRGWNTANDGSGTYYAPGDKFTISSNTTLYAVWVEGTKGTVTYNLKTNSSATSLDNCTSATPTSGDLIASTTINTYGDAGALSSGQSAKTSETQKLHIDAEYTAANYYEWTCAIASGKSFTPTQVVMKFQAVSDLTQYKVVLTDGTTSYNTNFVQTTSAGGTLETLTWNIASGAAFAGSGTMKLQLWAYKKNSDATAFRLGTPITINGVVASTGYSISFAGNGNTGGSTASVTSITSGSDVSQITANGFTKNGYTFDGWKTNTALTYVAYGDEDIEANRVAVAVNGIVPDKAKIKNVTSDITLTAQWSPITYDITYHENGASYKAGYTAPATYTVGTGATLPTSSNMTNTGYTFDGWKDNSSLTGDSKTTIGTSEYGDKEFWAKWTENTYTVTYSANGGTGDAMSSTVGHYVTLSANTYTKSGYIFAGWNTATDGSEASYSEGEEIELKANLDLYAIWATDYTITWEASPKLSGVAAKPNLGGGNYTITASVATWTGSLTTSMISAETSGVTITDVSVDNSASPKTITATFNVGASVTGDAITLSLDVPANGSYPAKSSEKEIDIDRCEGASGGGTTLFKAKFATGLNAISTSVLKKLKTDVELTTENYLSVLEGGDFTLHLSAESDIQAGNDSSIRLNKDAAYFEIELADSKTLQAGDIIKYVVGNNSPNLQVGSGSFSASTDISLEKTYWSTVVVPNGMTDVGTLYIKRPSGNADVHSIEIYRPTETLVYFQAKDGMTAGNLSTDVTQQTTSNNLAAVSGGTVYAGSTTASHLQITTTEYKLNGNSGYIKLVLPKNLAEGDMLYFNSSHNYQLAITSEASRPSKPSIYTDKKVYTIPAESDLIGESTIYLWMYSSSTNVKTLTVIRPGDGSGSSTIEPTFSWVTNPSSDAAWSTDHIAKQTGASDFTFAASTTSNTLGAITYSSSNTGVATVTSAGKVHIVGVGSTTITATLAASGCYEGKTLSYNIVVTSSCTDVAGTVALEYVDCSTGYRMTVSGHTAAAGVTYQWYTAADDEKIDGATSASYETSTAGEYYVIVTNTGSGHCAMASTNTVTIEAGETATATKLVNSWYVKNGRRTPDIALVQTTNAEGFYVKIGDDKIWDEANDITTGFGGCPFYLGADGIIYLAGQSTAGAAPTGLTANKTLKITATSCGGNASELSIDIKYQASTTRPSVAFVVDGTKEGDWDAVTSGHASGTDLYDYLNYNSSTNPTGPFDLSERNIYKTVNEQDIREHYSQFDAILITDDPSTDTKNGKKSYVDAFGTMVDIRPILTMEAYVSKLSNWKAKGINGTPSSPNPRQYAMKLQCKDHAIFKNVNSASSNVDVTTVDGVDYWTVTMIDNSKSPYSGLADNSETSDKPALQGFAASDVSGLLLLGEISGGSLYAGVERQEEPAARLMLLGVNNKALPNALTDEGKIIVKNALNYLLETDMENVDDCSNYFTGATSSDWNTASNWSKETVPNSPTTKVRILKPCVLSSGTIKAASVDIATSGKSGKGGGIAECTGSLTINAGAALIVGGQVRTAKAPYFNTADLMPTEAEDLVINTSSTAQAALIFNNDAGDTKATVNLYSLGRKESGHYQFQYYAVPMDYVSVSESFAGSDIYTYVWHEATGWERRGYYTDLYAFEGVGITTKSADPKTYTMKGTLASTTSKDITLSKDDDGYNLIGNSWIAPIQISQLEEDNSSLSNKTVYIYNAGNDTVGGGTEGNSPGQWTAIPFNAADFELWSGLKVIPAMQAFELVPTSEETLTLDYEKVVRGDNQTLTEKLHAPRRVADHAGIELMRIRVADSKTHTDLHLFEGERFSDEFDNGWEAAYKDGDDGTTKLYAEVALGRMAVVATDELEGTLLGFAPGKETEYTFTFGGEGMGYYLNDLKLMKSTLINEEATYSFTFEEGDTNRFYISRTPIEAPQTPTGVDNTRSGEVKAQKFIYNDKMYIMINGRVYSAEGQIVK